MTVTSKNLIISTRVMSTTLVILVILGITGPIPTGYAHVSGSTVQQWADNETGIKIEFAYKPEKPIADSPTELSFSVQNLRTGEHVKNIRASVVIINDFQRATKFLNIPVLNGDFILKYSFPDSGHNQILVSIDKDSFGLALASFMVSVSAPFPHPNLIAKSIIIGVVMPAAVMTSILVLIKNKNGQRFIK